MLHKIIDTGMKGTLKCTYRTHTIIRETFQKIQVLRKSFHERSLTVPIYLVDELLDFVLKAPPLELHSD